MELGGRLNDFRRSRSDAIGVSQIEGDPGDLCFWELRLDLGQCLLGIGLIPGTDNHACALAAENLCCLESDAAVASSDEIALSAEVREVFGGPVHHSSCEYLLCEIRVRVVIVGKWRD